MNQSAANWSNSFFDKTCVNIIEACSFLRAQSATNIDYSCSEISSKYKEPIKSTEWKWRCDLWDAGIFLARLGPIFVK